jgi:hypothetical protein
MEPKPTVGRIVHINQPGGAQPRAAIITFVYPGEDLGRINAFVMAENGSSWGESSLVPGTSPGNWSWPPRA